MLWANPCICEQLTLLVFAGALLQGAQNARMQHKCEPRNVRLTQSEQRQSPFLVSWDLNRKCWGTFPVSLTVPIDKNPLQIIRQKTMIQPPLLGDQLRSSKPETLVILMNVSLKEASDNFAFNHPASNTDRIRQSTPRVWFSALSLPPNVLEVSFVADMEQVASLPTKR